MSIGLFEEKMNRLKSNCEYGSFEYHDSSVTFSSVATEHFRNLARRQKYGVYIIRQLSSDKVLYIGKSGTIDRQGKFKGQDIPGRLKNVKGDVSANEWFTSLVNEKGALMIEYIFLETSPESPSLVEAILLQKYFNEHGCLPYRNKSF